MVHARQRIAILTAVFILSLGFIAIAPTATAPSAEAKNVCGQADFQRDGLYNGYITHSCDGGTTVTYKISCVGPDVQYTHYFGPAGESTRFRVSCGQANPIIGLSTYVFV